MEEMKDINDILDDKKPEETKPETPGIVLEEAPGITLEASDPVENSEAPNETVEEAPEEEETIDVVESLVVEPEPVQTPQEILDELQNVKKLITAHYQKLIGVVNFFKTKDESISKLSNSVKQYREGQSKQIFKAVVNPLIRFREDLRKLLSDIEVATLDLEKIKKFIGYIEMDYQEVLTNLGLEKFEQWEYDGNPIMTYARDGKKIEFKEDNFDNVSIELPEVELNSMADLAEFIKLAEDNITKLVAHSNTRDEVLRSYVDYCGTVEADYSRHKLAPVLISMAKLYDRISKSVGEKLEGINEENALDRYEELLLVMINQTEAILKDCDVLVERSVSDELDSLKDQIVKVIKLAEDDPLKDEKDRKIALRITDCYIQEGKVIYQSKVHVYKK